MNRCQVLRLFAASDEIVGELSNLLNEAKEGAVNGLAICSLRRNGDVQVHLLGSAQEDAEGVHAGISELIWALSIDPFITSEP